MQCQFNKGKINKSRFFSMCVIRNLQKNFNIIWQPPISRQPPLPPFCLRPPFLAKIFRPLPSHHLHQFWKSATSPHFMKVGWGGGGEGGGSELWRMLKTTEKLVQKAPLLFIFVIKSFSHYLKSLPPFLYLVGWLSVSLFHTAYVSFSACISCEETMSYP